jgi:hypothetical protein
MLTKEKENISATVTIRVADFHGADVIDFPGLHESGAHPDDRAGLFEFAGNAPATFAERYPRLMVSAVSVAVVVAAIMAEVECLHAAGYYWP